MKPKVKNKREQKLLEDNHCPYFNQRRIHGNSVVKIKKLGLDEQ